jgi:hypothetical protein
MNAHILNSMALAVGTAMVGVGVGVAFGWPFGLIAGGAMVVALALVALLVR